MKVLYIKANPKSDEESRTFRISEHFIREYKKHHPEDEIITLDLYKEEHFLDAKGVQLKYDRQGGRSDAQVCPPVQRC
jgi:FMN-dependent NADH-azoreductase